ncbi:unnamed protein product [Allacma fusca]|uniref:Uncharacterized protein n=1 Tax=Allacma fusca TaxID=39272 RepID=A0A8J2LYE6_9HEXA|nr:unnamed protein product [Allacma fusca]
MWGRKLRKLLHAGCFEMSLWNGMPLLWMPPAQHALGSETDSPSGNPLNDTSSKLTKSMNDGGDNDSGYSSAKRLNREADSGTSNSSTKTSDDGAEGFTSNLPTKRPYEDGTDQTPPIATSSKQLCCNSRHVPKGKQVRKSTNADAKRKDNEYDFGNRLDYGVIGEKVFLKYPQIENFGILQ